MHVSNKNTYQRGVELIISPKCNLGCTYCYLHKNRKEIFGEECFNEEKTISNLKLILKWLAKHEYNPNLDIFSGELLAQEVGYRVLETIAEHEATIPQVLRPKTITIPTNFTFVNNEDLVKRVENIRAKLKDLGITLCLSASFDGKYMEQNRPFLHELDLETGCKERADEYYDKAFAYAASTFSGFHPMLYSKGMDKWVENFNWFQKKFEEYNIPWDAIYLLQVRNEEWDQKSIKDLYNFVQYLHKFAFEKLDKDPKRLVDWILEAKGFNILSWPFSKCGRGLTCGIQSMLTIRVSDMKMYPCHRLGYKDFIFGEMVEDEEEILKVKTNNVELMLATYITDKRSLPGCAQCPINHLCTGPCLGSQYESTKSLFTPIPSVCLVTYAICLACIKSLKDLGAWNYALRRANDDSVAQLKFLEEKFQC